VRPRPINVQTGLHPRNPDRRIYKRALRVALARPRRRSNPHTAIVYAQTRALRQSSGQFQITRTIRPQPGRGNVPPSRTMHRASWFRPRSTRPLRRGRFRRRAIRSRAPIHGIVVCTRSDSFRRLKAVRILHRKRRAIRIWSSWCDSLQASSWCDSLQASSWCDSLQARYVLDSLQARYVLDSLQARSVLDSLQARSVLHSQA